MNIQAEQYAKSIIKTALANGLTPEQIAANPKACMRAHLKARLRMWGKLEKEVWENRKELLNL